MLPRFCLTLWSIDQFIILVIIAVAILPLWWLVDGSSARLQNDKVRFILTPVLLNLLVVDNEIVVLIILVVTPVGLLFLLGLLLLRNNNFVSVSLLTLLPGLHGTFPILFNLIIIATTPFRCHPTSSRWLTQGYFRRASAKLGKGIVGHAMLVYAII